MVSKQRGAKEVNDDLDVSRDFPWASDERNCFFPFATWRDFLSPSADGRAGLFPSAGGGDGLLPSAHAGVPEEHVGGWPVGLPPSGHVGWLPSAQGDPLVLADFFLASNDSNCPFPFAG